MSAAVSEPALVDGEHPAVAAWRALGADRVIPSAVEPVKVRKPTTKSSIYRLVQATRDGGPVIAKRIRAGTSGGERMMYEEVLPLLPVSRPRYYGGVEAEDGNVWIFLEDVGAQRWYPVDPAQRELAARWLGALHAAAADLPNARYLPDCGPRRYYEHLTAGRRLIVGNLDNPALRPDDAALLRAIVGQCDALERRWQELEEICAAAPPTLVHGDFRPKNVFVRGAGGAEQLLPLDWEMAGWGVPAPDLAPGRHSFGPPLDLDIYCGVVRERWPGFGVSLAQRLAWAGLIFQRLAAIEWASTSKVGSRSNAVVDNVPTLRRYHEQLAGALSDPPPAGR